MFVGTSLANTQYRVAYIARAQADSFAAWLANSIVEEANKYDHITVRVFDGQADNAQQNALIENAIVNGYDLIIIQPNDGEAQRPYAELVVESGIHLITTNARIDGVEGASSVDADPYMQAAVVAEMALEQVPQNANVVVLNGPPGNFHASERRKAWEAEFFQKRPDVKIVGEQIANWNKDEAMRYMEDWVQANDRIEAIISMNDNMAAGAIEVIKDDPKFKNMLAYGVDGTIEAALLIKGGLMTATTLQSAYELAERILWVSDLLLRGEVFEIHTDIGNPVITLENVDEVIEMHRRAGNL
ncbi:MAG: sugar ABC transporter substrate-binding protein [Bacillota bacterium]|nr:sugar ABC transporter substrate-binding protein [Bacillota bacterium]